MYLCCSGDAGQGRSGGEGGGPHGHGHESSLLRNGVVGKCAESVDLRDSPPGQLTLYSVFWILPTRSK